MHDTPHALVDHEGSLSTHASVVVSLRHNPRRGVGNSEVEDLALHDESVEAVHDLLDGASVVPPVDVEDVNVIRAQLSERVVDGVEHRLDAVANECTVLARLSSLVIGGVLNMIRTINTQDRQKK